MMNENLAMAKSEQPTLSRKHRLNLASAPLVALVAAGAHAQSTPMQLGCSGQLIEPTSKTSSPKPVQLTIGSEKVGVDFGSGNVAAQVESNNKIQLKFKSDEFVGEYFYYTGDLFLIYKSGHLARLTCKQSRADRSTGHVTLGPHEVQQDRGGALRRRDADAR
jgi:hypothetical protein